MLRDRLVLWPALHLHPALAHTGYEGTSYRHVSGEPANEVLFKMDCEQADGKLPSTISI